MKFLIDAQLPVGVKKILVNSGYDAIHTDDLPNKERTTDNQIREVANNENRIIISKDSDFVDSFHIKKSPKKLLLITTGNIRNGNLYMLLTKNIGKIIELFKSCNLVEMSNSDIVGHE
jgi:predicted nuclease of predicted toxin-antitoxin system